MRVLSLGELGSVCYTSNEEHLLEVERLSFTGEVMYRHSYLYDESGKLLSENLIGDLGEVEYKGDAVIQSPFSLEVCEYDENHNLIRHTLDDVSNVYSYNIWNQLNSEDEEPLCSYDGFGNITAYGKNQYVYDDDQNLVQMIKPGFVVSYAYDQHGMRISRTLNGDTIYYIYFGSNEIAILDSDGKVQEIRIPGLSSHKDILRPIAIETKDAIYAPIHDVQGNIVRLINISNKEVLKINEINPFGKGLPNNAPTSWLFAGKNFDKETGLIYFGERYYCPALKAWLSPDHMKQSVNHFQYCQDNPLSNFDSSYVYAFVIPPVSLTWGARGIITAPIWVPYVAVAALGAGIGYLGYKANEGLNGEDETTFFLERSRKGSIYLSLLSNRIKKKKWEDISHPRAKKNGHYKFRNRKTGEIIEFDKGKAGKNGHQGHDHYHRPNPNKTGESDWYLDGNGNPVPDGSENSHLYPPQ